MLSERQSQASVLHTLTHSLGYSLVKSSPSPVDPSLLTESLSQHGYSQPQISAALSALSSACKNLADPPQKVSSSVYSLLRYGLQGSSRRKSSVHFIDWDHTKRNSFTVSEEVSLPCRQNSRHCRLDLVLRVNGIALVVIELKRIDVPVEDGISQLITYQQPENIPQFFSTVQLLIAGNESQGIRYATAGTPAKAFMSWTEEDSAADPASIKVRNFYQLGNNPLINGLISLCLPERLLTLCHDFIVFDSGIKKTARHNQFFAVKAAQERLSRKEGGIIWNTQGSGKSLIMVWLAQWIVEHHGRVVIITDREELDKQIASLFSSTGTNLQRAKNCSHLRELLASPQHSVICTLIHKYGHGSDIEDFSRELLAGENFYMRASGNITAFIDECHRTNSGVLHDAVRKLMPDAVLVGFTGTPLLHSDKKTTVQTFGTFIHTYKFDDAITDGVILPLRYEARNIEQSLADCEAIDAEFERRTEGLTEKGKGLLLKRWATLSKLYSSRERLERIAGDIMADFETVPELSAGRQEKGTAMLAAGSVYEACRYWEIFQAAGFTKCAVITSYDPAGKDARAASSDLSVESEEDCKKRVYRAMLGEKSLADFEREALDSFRHDPENMRLLIVVDRLLTGFDAPNAVYLYIDKSMRDHGLFQAVCRVNRPSEGKTHGLIVDYMDLFKCLQSAVHDYTSEAFCGYDKADVEGLISDRYDEAAAEMEKNREKLRAMLGGVAGDSDSEYLEYFCDELSAKTRERFYMLVYALTRSFAECSGRLVSHYGYSPEGVSELREEIGRYSRLKEIVRLKAGDALGRSYDAYMREILDRYVKAGMSETIGVIEDISAAEDLGSLLEKLPCDDMAKAEIIEGNVRREIIIRTPGNPERYGKLSLELERLILKRKSSAVDYQEYIREMEGLVKKVLGRDDEYPAEVDTPAKRAMYDYFGGNVELALRVNDAVRNSLTPEWRGNSTKEKRICRAVYECLVSGYFADTEAQRMTQDIFGIVLNQPEYTFIEQETRS